MVPEEIWMEMPTYPEIGVLEAERTKLKGGRYRIRGMENEKSAHQFNL